MATVRPNLDGINLTICELSNDIANKEQQIEQLNGELKQSKEDENRHI